MIELRDVWFSYTKDKNVLKGINLKINNNVTIIMGPNGAGKTTLLKIISCLYKPDKGEVLIDGLNFWKANSKDKLSLRRKLVYVHENPVLFKGTVVSNVMYPLLIRGYSRENAKKEALELLNRMGIDHIAFRQRDELSAGEAQLVAFARAIISGAKYIILDEPISSLDLEHRKRLEFNLKDLVREGRKIIIATHDRLFAFKLKARVIEIDQGQLSREFSSEELITELDNIIFS